MFWQVTKLILRMWRHRLGRLLSRYPLLWGMVVLAPLIYGGGSYLLHAALYRMLNDISHAPHLPPNGVQIIAFSFFSSFGLTTFLMTMIVHLLIPDDTVFSRIFAPLPISLHQQYLGTMLPGFVCLFVGQLAMWGPILSAFGRAFPVPALQFAITVLFGLVCYSSVTAAIYQASLYGAIQLFGSNRVALRSMALPISLIVGVIVLMVTLMAGGVALTAGRVPVWLLGIPAFWMSLGISERPEIAGLGLGLLTLGVLVSGWLHRALLQLTAKVSEGTRGCWVPLRRLPFGRGPLWACGVYEWKTAAREQHVVVGLALLGTLVIVMLGAIVWLQQQPNLFPPALLIQIVGMLNALLLCTLAHMSWGRDREQRQVLAATPLAPGTLISGKLGANLLALSGIWLLLMGAIALFDRQIPLAEQFPMLPLGVVIAFVIGIILPYSLKDPLSTIVAMSVFLFLGLPTQLLLQELGTTIQRSIALSNSEFRLVSWLFYLVVIVSGYLSALWLDTVRAREHYD